VFYIASIGEKSGIKDPWKQICIGSDFDGFIRAIDSCKNIAQLTKFGSMIIDRLPGIAKEAKIELPRAPRQLVEDIFCNNAYNFISSHLGRQP
jgi:hypothetical protein